MKIYWCMAIIGILMVCFATAWEQNITCKGTYKLKIQAKNLISSDYVIDENNQCKDISQDFYQCNCFDDITLLNIHFKIGKDFKVVYEYYPVLAETEFMTEMYKRTNVVNVNEKLQDKEVAKLQLGSMIVIVLVILAILGAAGYSMYLLGKKFVKDDEGG